ncbi:hypothetical protein PV325_002822 [Microctonus aethiopoides]|uniref:Selenoprotein M n=1 Tax=Microctonus aethiopoides TaxID=144406 RepID=A0AA39CAK2_9HYME|nr:hypothetical protein PV325_002822 [Microctonus aethiopoides]KAK0091876.1 hypothetical protein PV326_002585 [Microctonus aethiopoides]KAK0160848.1 hypothetical protein PV328_008214 [Microctonus aethiopoides]
MRMLAKSSILLILICVSISVNKIGAKGGYAYAVVESCSGCSLNRLPDVKQFIFNDVPHYDRVEFKHIQGAVPELVLYDSDKEEVERLALSRLTRDECNELLANKGFKRVVHTKDEV